ncbi:unnamed protein product [Adineta ricciae]|uniref:Uncharacterized protein n=1 Tax=Adineta ricciae TaxID=249248 RepID=A0A815JTW7_ADIRI|nr:unnamed protein product [Adineta ricciae]
MNLLEQIFNCDNHFDIVASISTPIPLGVFLRYGNRCFSNTETFSTGIDTNPYGLSVEDYDNQSDIVTGNVASSRTSFLIRDDLDYFILLHTYSTETATLSNEVVVDDLNNDENLNVIVFNHIISTANVFLGYDNENDFNNDNIADIALANTEVNTIVILFDVGDESFLLGITYSTATLIITIIQISLLRILKRTILITIFHVYNSKIFILTSMYSTGVPSQPYIVVVDYFDNEDSVDIVIGNSNTSQISFVLYGDENGIFRNEISYLLKDYESLQHSIALIDLNQDKRIDMVVGSLYYKRYRYAHQNM